MLSLILLAVSVISLLGFLFVNEYRHEFLKSFSGMVLILSLFINLMHTLAYYEQDYKFEKFKVTHDSLQMSLDATRKNGNQYESVAVIKTIIKHNNELAQKQFSNSRSFNGHYVDDRFDDLKPVE
tara:strand:- start:100 stop:474 length:375 start_codon:yes stop_codon:yes gene_type:complete